MSESTGYDDLPPDVKDRIEQLPKDVWAGELQDIRCVHCGHNSWREIDDYLGYSRHYAHHVEAFECLYCSATGGWVTDARQDTRLTQRIVGALDHTGDSE